jgi:hypothetical protein
MILEDLCDNNNLQFIDHTKVFNDRHGYVKQQFFHHDGIHLSKKGRGIPDTINTVSIFDLALKRYNRD